MLTCSVALALGGGGTARRVASPQAPALSSALDGRITGQIANLLSLYIICQFIRILYKNVTCDQSRQLQLRILCI
jgi:hypothetical protein